MLDRKASEPRMSAAAVAPAQWMDGLLLSFALCAAAACALGYPGRVRFNLADGIGLALALISAAAWFAVGRYRLRLSGAVLSVLLLSGSLMVAGRPYPFWVIFALLGGVWFAMSVWLFASGRRRWSLAAFGAALILGLLSTADATCLIVETYWTAPRIRTEGRLHESDPELMNITLPNTRAIQYTCRGPVEYHTDADRSRTVPGRPDEGPTWLVVGGSFAFGSRLNDEETFPARLQALRPDVRIFNCGVGYQGTADSYLRLRRELSQRADVEVCLYVFIRDHFRRVACPDSLIYREGKRPRFALIDGQLRYLGRAGDTRSPVSRINTFLLRRSALYRTIYPAYRPDDADRDLTAALVNAMQRECVSHGNCRFVLVHWPTPAELNPDQKEDWHPWLRDWLLDFRESGIEFVDGLSLMEAHLRSTGEPYGDYYVREDDHPNPRFTDLMARWVHEALRDASQASGAER